VTRSQRRIRARKTGQLPSEVRTFAVGLNLAENANRGKRHAARLDGSTVQWLTARIAREENAATLTQHERYRRSDGRRFPDKRTATGSPSPASYATTYGKRRAWTASLDG
jgi:hypothetical protein